MHAPHFEPIGNNIAVMRNRLRVKIDEDSDYSDGDSGKHHGVNGAKKEESHYSDKGSKYHGSKGRTNGRSGKLFMMVLLFANLLLLGEIYIVMMKRRRNQPTRGAPPAADTYSTSTEAKVSDVGEDTPVTNENDWSHCTTNPPQPTLKAAIDKRVEPMWLPSYPSSLPLTYPDFIAALTGVTKGAKSYYRSSPQLKRCHYSNSNYKIDAVTCEIVHPIVPCKRPSPSSQSNYFGRKVLLSLRNPLTAFFSHYQMKQEAYHGQQGQVEKENWIKLRDQYVGNGTYSILFNEWEDFIWTWRDMDPYHMAEYLPYEYWTDEIKGPALVKRLSQIFRDEGYPALYNVTDVNDSKKVECLWRTHFYEPLIAEEKKHTEQGWYVPEFTTEQMEYMASRLEAFADQIKEKQTIDVAKLGRRPGDDHIISILADYASSVRKRMQ